MAIDKNSSKRELSFGIFTVALIIIIGVLFTHEYIITALLLKEVGVFIAPIFLGFANSLLHVIGGKEVLVMSDKSMHGGIYVSSGAFGLGLGIFLSSLEIEPTIPIAFSVCLMLGLAIAHHFTKFEYPSKETPVIYKTVKSNSVNLTILLVVGICAAIAFRSLLGYSGQINPLQSEYSVLILAGCAVFGKAFGGVLQDFLGTKVVIIVSTYLGILSLVLSRDYNWTLVIFVLSVNLLMPVTLDAIRRFLPKKEGFAFGLTAAFVLIGYLLFLLINSISWLRVLSIILVFVTGITLFLIDVFMRKKLCEM